jgi:hypothetical protein
MGRTQVREDLSMAVGQSLAVRSSQRAGSSWAAAEAAKAAAKSADKSLMRVLLGMANRRRPLF